MLTMASATRSSRPASGGGAPGSTSLRTCAPMASMISTALPLPSIKRLAVMPRRSCGTLSRPCGGKSPGFCTAMETASLMRARLTMHSRSTASLTCLNSKSCSAGISAAEPLALAGKIRFTSWPSRLSSTDSSTPATFTSASSDGVFPSATICDSSESSCWMRSRNSPSPRTPSVSLIFFNNSSCGTSSSVRPPPRRTKISSTSFTFERSSLIAAATVRINLTLGADRLSRSCSMLSSTGSRSASLNEARTAEMRPPRVDACAT